MKTCQFLGVVGWGWVGGWGVAYNVDFRYIKEEGWVYRVIASVGHGMLPKRNMRGLEKFPLRKFMFCLSFLSVFLHNTIQNLLKFYFVLCSFAAKIYLQFGD